MSEHSGGTECLECDVDGCETPAIARVFPTFGQTDHEALRCKKCLEYDFDRRWFRQWAEKIAARHDRNIETDTDRREP